MKKKVILIFSIVLLVFSVSFLVGQKVVSSRLSENKVSYNINKEDKPTIQEENIEDENDSKENETMKEDNEKKENQEKVTKNKTTSKTNTNTKKNVNVNDNSNTTITSSNETNETNTKSETIEESEVTNTKYGVKFLNVKKYEIITNNDGTVDKKLISTYKSMDASFYNATIDDLKDEAIELVNKNWSKYDEVLNYINGYRSEVGVTSLTLDYDLSVAATIRALEMAYTNNMSHTRPNGTKCFTIFNDLHLSSGYYAGENIAEGYSSAKSVSEGWKNSSSHYANIVKSAYRKTGIGMVQLSGTKYGTYWAQLFVG